MANPAVSLCRHHTPFESARVNLMLPRKISQGIGALAFLSYSVHAVEPVGALMYSNMHTVEIEKPVELYTLFE